MYVSEKYYLDCSGNMLNSLNHLPIYSSLVDLYCYNNFLTELPPLPDNLKYFACHFNTITQLPPLPPSLKKIWCDVLAKPPVYKLGLIKMRLYN